MNRDQIEEAIYILSQTYETPETYYQSEVWKAMRELVLKIQGNHCNRCGIVIKHPHIHHSYGLDNSHDAETDFEVLCFDCHDVYHGGCLSEEGY